MPNNNHLTDVAIVATCVAEEDRPNFLPHHFIKYFLLLENKLYDLADRFGKEYRGGCWDFYDLSNGGGYLGLEPTRLLTVSMPNGYSAIVNGNTFGIIVSLYAINWLSHDTLSEHLADKYHLLHDFACQQPESALILSAID